MGTTNDTTTPTAKPLVERWEDAPSYLMWGTVVRLFVGGPLHGRAIEGADSREGEAGPMAATSDYWHGWFLYKSQGMHGVDGWLVYTLDPAETLRRAKAKYIADEIDHDELEQALDWALMAEQRELDAD